jgi:NAD(P)-dependent dehydrogenase (short-subunit alcohol dehydrogenase family)
MTRMLAVEWAAHNIRVNAIAPGRLMTASPSRAHKGGRSFLHGGDAQTHPLAPAGKCRRGRLRRSLSRIYCEVPKSPIKRSKIEEGLRDFYTAPAPTPPRRLRTPSASAAGRSGLLAHIV